MEALVQDLQAQLQEQHELLAAHAAQIEALVRLHHQAHKVQARGPFALTPAQAHQDVTDLSTTTEKIKRLTTTESTVSDSEDS
jgi:hypothetical protein